MHCSRLLFKALARQHIASRCCYLTTTTTECAGAASITAAPAEAPPHSLDVSHLRSIVRKHSAVVNVDVCASLPNNGIPLHLINNTCDVYHMTPEQLPPDIRRHGDPFWGFVWPGSWGLCRLMAQRPSLVQGRRVLDFAAGCGIAGIVAAQLGASSVVCNEIDALAIAAMEENLELNRDSLGTPLPCTDYANRVGSHSLPVHPVHSHSMTASSSSSDTKPVDVLLAGDVTYESPLAEEVVAWLGGLAAQGVEVWLGDPGRGFLPSEGASSLSLEAGPTYELPRHLMLENSGHTTVQVYRVCAGPR